MGTQWDNTLRLPDSTSGALDAAMAAWRAGVAAGAPRAAASLTTPMPGDAVPDVPELDTRRTCPNCGTFVTPPENCPTCHAGWNAPTATSPEGDEAQPVAHVPVEVAPEPPEDASVRVTKPRGATNDGEKVRDVVLGLTETQLDALTKDVAHLQRVYETRTFVATLLRAVHNERNR